MSERIVVAMSGGVDSSVAAALLVERGAEAIGVTLHLAGSNSRCCSLEDADDARRVAERLGLPALLPRPVRCTVMKSSGTSTRKREGVW